MRILFTPHTASLVLRDETAETPITGVAVSIEGEEAPRLFVHPALGDDDEASWGLSHISGLGFGMPKRETMAQCQGLAEAVLGDDLLRYILVHDRDEACARASNRDALLRFGHPSFTARISVLTTMARDMNRAAVAEAWAQGTADFLADPPKVEDLLERLEMDIEAMEVDLHPDEDRFLEWVESLSNVEKSDIVRACVEACEDGGETDILDLSNGVAEPGYGESDMALGSWWVHAGPKNDLRESKIVRLLSACGVESVFSDEWATCVECHKAVRTQGDSYHWTRSYWASEYGAVCLECVTEDPEEYLIDLRGNHRVAHVLQEIDLTDHGYMQVWGEFESGLYGGQMDSPSAVAAAFEARGWEDFIFVVNAVGQFDLKFSVFLRVEWDEDEDEDEDELPEYRFVAGVPTQRWGTELVADEDWETRTFATAEEASKHGEAYVWANFEPRETHDGEDPAEAMKRGLQAAGEQMAAARVVGTDGILYSSVHTDGTATTRVVSKEEFIQGLKP
jgi:hypothetical protein